MAQEELILAALKQIQSSIVRLQSDVDRIKKAVLAEAEVEEQELDLEKDIREVERLVPSKPPVPNVVRYSEETVDEVEKELGE